MFIDFLEIGTSDFDTEIQKKDNKIGFSIEPIKFYLDRLPNKKNCRKILCAISNKNSFVNVNYISTKLIKKHNLPNWVRGCNSINNYHPTVANLLKKKNIDIKKVVSTDKIPCKTIQTIINENNISGIFFLKIDTEGHDCVILNNFYDELNNNLHLPHKILFESNILTNKNDVNKIINLFKTKGYDLINSNHDTLLMLNLLKIKRENKFTDKINKYYIEDYPPNYDIKNLPHKNTLEDAKKFCKENNCSGITYKNNRYEVRNGKYIKYINNDKITSWLFL